MPAIGITLILCYKRSSLRYDALSQTSTTAPVIKMWNCQLFDGRAGMLILMLMLMLMLLLILMLM